MIYRITIYSKYHLTNAESANERCREKAVSNEGGTGDRLLMQHEVACVAPQVGDPLKKPKAGSIALEGVNQLYADLLTPRIVDKHRKPVRGHLDCQLSVRRLRL